MKLQRYDIVGHFNEVECDTGSFLYADDALDWFESLLQPIVAPASVKHFDPFIEKRIANATAVNAELDRLRALIAAERGKG